MRIALRAIALAAVVAVPFTATPATAGPAVCISYSDRNIYTGPAGTVSAPMPSRVELNCTVAAVLEFVPGA